MSAFDRNDLGKGSLNQFRGVLVPINSRVRIRLAGSNQFQQELTDISESGETKLTTATARRTQQQEGADTEIEVRLFTGSRVTGPVGFVPRGLESVMDEALSRLDISGQHQRIPVEIMRKRGLFRVELLIGQTR
ncbi:hypothetical protein IWX81_000319 [Salinibacterium sp. CAN_S4]|uniref:hypothetical protein n=1 Tax=Salinibacterium sp. CAN_S4 TaxID=2787727 RepID=UPI0018EF8EDA